MIATADLKKQHKEIGSLVEVLSILIHSHVEVRQSPVVFELYTRLMEKLDSHLALEAKHLYPELLTCQDETVRLAANNFLRGGKVIHDFFAKYKKQWSKQQKIEENLQTFVQESEQLFSFLAKRINAEEGTFFRIIEEKMVASH